MSTSCYIRLWNLWYVFSSQGNRTNYNRTRDPNGAPAGRKSEESISNSEAENSAASRFQSYDYQRASPITDTTSLNSSTQASEHEDAQSGIIVVMFLYKILIPFSVH